MPDIYDSNIDLSNVAGSLTPAVPSGLTTFALLGKSLQASLRNYAIPTSPLLTSSSGVAMPTITSGVSGATVNASSQLILPDVPSTGSETIFVVMSINPSNWTSFNANLLGCWNGTAGTLQQACYMNAASTLSGVQFNIGYVTGAGTDASISLATFVTSGALGTTTAEQAIVSTPQLYMMKFDIPNLLVTFVNLTQHAIVGAPATTKSTFTLTAGSTRPVITPNYPMLGNIQTPTNTLATFHAYVRYNRATLAGNEDAPIIAQIRKIMSIRGVTV